MVLVLLDNSGQVQILCNLLRLKHNLCFVCGNDGDTQTAKAHLSSIHSSSHNVSFPLNSTKACFLWMIISILNVPVLSLQTEGNE